MRDPKNRTSSVLALLLRHHETRRALDTLGLYGGTDLPERLYGSRSSRAYVARQAAQGAAARNTPSTPPLPDCCYATHHGKCSFHHAKERRAMLLAPAPGSEDKEMLRQAAMLTRDLHRPDPLVYWGDCFGSAAIGYAALLGAIASGSALLTGALVLVSILTLYRAVLFIHEITHLDHRKLPGFRLAWNIGVGAPLMLPSFLYEGIHAVHHSRVHYGTERDPEYIPLAHMRPWSPAVHARRARHAGATAASLRHSGAAVVGHSSTEEGDCGAIFSARGQPRLSSSRA